MKFPIVLVDDGNLFMFDSAERAVIYMEYSSIDVGYFEGYDADGKKLELVANWQTEVKRVLFFKTSINVEGVHIRLAQPVEDKKARLRTLLKQYIERVNMRMSNDPPDNFDQLSLDQLIEWVTPYAFQE